MIARTDSSEMGPGAEAVLGGLLAGLGQLRSLPAGFLLTRSIEALCRSCGFSRALLFRIDDDRIVPTRVHVSDAPAGFSGLFWDQPLPLSALPLESEMLRRRIPLLVDDVRAEPRVHGAFGGSWDASSYVAAPLMPQGDVIGFVYADRQGQRREVDAVDRTTVAVFAESLGFAYEAAVLKERLSLQRGQVRDVLRSTEEIFDEFMADETRRTDHVPAPGGTRLPDRSPSRLEQLLTPREIDVLQLLAAGETSAGIAGRLGISEGTVKSYVKHILRKLRAANRAEAVARYLRITAVDRRG